VVQVLAQFKIISSLTFSIQYFVMGILHTHL